MDRGPGGLQSTGLQSGHDWAQNYKVTRITSLALSGDRQFFFSSNTIVVVLK